MTQWCYPRRTAFGCGSRFGRRKASQLRRARIEIHWSHPTIALGPNRTTGWEANINRPAVVKAARRLPHVVYRADRRALLHWGSDEPRRIDVEAEQRGSSPPTGSTVGEGRRDGSVGNIGMTRPDYTGCGTRAVTSMSRTQSGLRPAAGRRGMGQARRSSVSAGRIRNLGRL